MTKHETCETLNILKAGYPLFYSNAKPDFMGNVIGVWHNRIGQYSKDVVDRAILDMIDHETQIPTIALVRSYITKQIEADAKKAKRENAWKEAGFQSKEAYEARKSEFRR